MRRAEESALTITFNSPAEVQCCATIILIYYNSGAVFRSYYCNTLEELQSGKSGYF